MRSLVRPASAIARVAASSCRSRVVRPGSLPTALSPMPTIAWGCVAVTRGSLPADTANLYHGPLVERALVGRAVAELHEDLRIMLAEPGRGAHRGPTDAGQGSYREQDIPEVRMVERAEKAAVDELRVLREIQRRRHRRGGDVAPLRFLDGVGLLELAGPL